MNRGPPSGFASPTEVAKALGVHVGTVYRWLGKEVRGKRLRSFYIGGRRKIAIHDLERFLFEERDTQPEDTTERYRLAQNVLRSFGIRKGEKG